MPAYEATIQLKVQGQDRLKYVLDSVEKINQITSKLKPISLTRPGEGSAGDAVRVLKKELDDFSRAIINFKPEGITKRARELSTTLAGSATQAGALATALENVGLKTGGFSRQSAEVKNYSLALLEAEKNAKRLATISEQVKRGARVAQIAGRFGVSSEDVEKRLNNLREIRYKKDREADAARYFAQKREEDFEIRLQKIRERNAARTAAQEQTVQRTRQLNESLALGVGFPLLFGGGIGSVAGSFAGSFAGKGFGGQILGGAIGQAIDNFVVGLTQVTANLETTAKAAGIAGTATERHIEFLVEEGKEQEALALATERLARVVGSEGVRALKDFERAGVELSNAFAQLGIQFQALIAQLAAPTVRGVASAVEESVLIRQAERSQDPRQIEDIQRRNRAIGNEYYEIQQRILDRQREINAAIEDESRALMLAAQARSMAAQEARSSLAISELDLQIAEAGGDLASEKVKYLMQQRIELQYAAEQQQLISELTKDQADFMLIITKLQNVQLKYKTDLANLENRATRRLATDADAQAREEKQTNTLRARVALGTRLLEIDQKLAAAKLEENEVLTLQLKIDRAMAETAGKVAEIRAQKLPADQEALRIKQAETSLEDKLLQLDLDRAVVLRERQKTFNDMFANLEYEVEYEKAITREQREQLQLSEELRKAQKQGFTPEQLGALSGKIQERQKQQRPLQSYITDAERELTDLERYAVAVSDGIGNAIANSMSQGIQGLIEGTKTAQQVFADFLKGVGDVLIQEGTRMIAMYIAIGIAKAFAGLGGNDGVGGGAEGRLAVGKDIPVDKMPAGMKFAEGGFVTGPTNALIGEGGEPEYVIPASKMRGAMNRYAAGARGSSVIPSGGEQGTGEGGTAVATPIDVRYTVERINSVDYVTADQFQAGMQQAAQQGAAQGEQRTLRRLQMSTSTRKRLGM